MKGTCALVASAVAASTVALTSSAYKGESVNSRGTSAGKDKYAPRFDGLRFIETLVTAHRYPLLVFYVYLELKLST
ncbi:hypothetical protein PHJA_000583300 [Phtheirospermum japonicum]|uniref:Uncharacterized protein n=1 Tax=Phtheirospermum japonicum TaxID=374723 RepID=A0A830BKG8_9LAMI|nr:hypothetical protein PHJA_000583300 [Phtheirospermum japonicum]